MDGQTDKPKPICLLNFFKLVDIKKDFFALRNTNSSWSSSLTIRGVYSKYISIKIKNSHENSSMFYSIHTLKYKFIPVLNFMFIGPV